LGAVLIFAVGTGVGARWWAEAPPTDSGSEDTHSHWTCSMHPEVQANQPGSCPICGMDLVEVSDAPVRDSGAAEGIRLSARARARARIRTSVVARQGRVASGVRLLGRVESNEAKRKLVTTWVDGRIDRLVVNTTGAKVRRGQTVATLYSPEVYAAHQDLIVAKRQSDSALATATLRAARERLALLGVPSAELDRMESAQQPTRSVAMRSPFSGTVLDLEVTEGAYVNKGEPLMRLADLSTVWVQLDVYEDDLGRVDKGAEVLVTIESLPGVRLAGAIDFIEPQVDAASRTTRARVTLDNENGDLRPGMFAQAIVKDPIADRDSSAPLVVPSSAPLFTGKRALVYVEFEHPEGPTYAPRTVRLGPRTGDFYPVVAGLSEGERVVTRGAFAIDADLQIRGGGSMMAQLARWREPAPDEEKAAPPRLLGPVFSAYVDVQEALAEDDQSRAKAAATRLQATLNASDEESLGALVGLNAALVESDSIEASRAAFEPMSALVTDWLRVYGNPLDQPLRVAFCPMAFGDSGASWVQKRSKIDNAYFGAMMRTCGSFLEVVQPGQRLVSDQEVPEGVLSHDGHKH
ncbi:MAG: efflux RND transporter periplasmic adaptor subunit, partial [Myxococcota bacterium]